MRLISRHQLFAATLVILATSCQRGPKVVEANTGTDNDPTFTVNPEIEVRPAAEAPPNRELHQVEVLESIPADRYVYIRVREGVQTRWIATRKMEITRGAVYYYRGGLLKTGFESQDLGRRFDTIYLVSSLVAEDHALHVNQQSAGAPSLPAPAAQPEKGKISTHGEAVVSHKGVLPIAELVADPGKYEGHTVQIHGTCVKVNPNIMERNWIHVHDGSRDDYDLVITSSHYIPEGSEFTMSATVALNRDFGAGYTYDLILEDGMLVE